MKELPVIYECEDYLAVNKPAGLLTLPDRYDTAQASLRQLLEDRYERIWVVHRLDRDTSGLVLFARNEATHRYLSGLFENRAISKTYLGIVVGSMPPGDGLISEPIAEHPFRKGEMTVHKKGKPSRTEYKVLEDFGRYSLVEFRILTGRTHQIRVHARFAGHPVICDPVYGDGKPVMLSSFKKKYKPGAGDKTEQPLISRLGLHALRLGFTDVAGMSQILEAPVPRDMRALVQQLQRNRS